MEAVHETREIGVPVFLRCHALDYCGIIMLIVRSFFYVSMR